VTVSQTAPLLHESGPRLVSTDPPAVTELARLLSQLAWLASYVNSNKCTDRDREQLREQVPASIYFQVLTNLASLRSVYARRHMRTSCRTERLHVDLTGFFEDYGEIGV